VRFDIKEILRRKLQGKTKALTENLVRVGMYLHHDKTFLQALRSNLSALFSITSRKEWLCLKYSVINMKKQV